MATELIPGLVPFLRACAPVLAASGGEIAQDFLPDGVGQGISFVEISDTPRPTFTSMGRHKVRLQFTFQAATADAQNAMHAAVYNALCNPPLRGQLPKGGVYITSVFFITARGGRSEATLQHAMTADYYLFFN